VTDEAKRSKALRTIQSLQRVVDHPNTGDGEREAAMGRIKALKEKWSVTEAKPRVTIDHGDRTGGFNSTSSSNTWVNDNFKMWFDEHAPDDPEVQAAKIRRQAAEYAAFLRREEARKKQEADRKKWEAEREARRKREQAERKRRAEAQKRWQERNRNRDARGVPLTDAEMEEARRDPLAWALKQDGRTAQQKNDEMQNRHKPHPLRCEPKATFYDQGGEPRPRNSHATDCYSCGTHLRAGEGAMVQTRGEWQTVCCEAIPGPRKKKPGRS
jgi:hypothetical protein